MLKFLTGVGLIVIIAFCAKSIFHLDDSPTRMMGKFFAQVTSGDSFDGIAIRGDDTCSTKTKEALTLLQKKAPTHYADVKKYIGVIQCTLSNSGMYANENPPRYQVGNETRDAGAKWYASTIVHDANHSKLYNDYLDAHPGAVVPADVWTGKQAESKCIDVQYDALKQVGADAKTLAYLRSTLGTNYWNDANRSW